MMDVLVLVGTAIETVKKLRAIADKIKDADARNLIADLSIALADLKMEVARLKEDNLRLQSALDQKQATERRVEQLVYRDGALYFETPPPGKAPGPYCPNCKESGKLVQMKDNRGTPFEQICKFNCPACKSHF